VTLRLVTIVNLNRDVRAACVSSGFSRADDDDPPSVFESMTDETQNAAKRCKAPDVEAHSIQDDIIPFPGIFSPIICIERLTHRPG
jgi:hypothetical protein